MHTHNNEQQQQQWKNNEDSEKNMRGTMARLEGVSVHTYIECV